MRMRWTTRLAVTATCVALVAPLPIAAASPSPGPTASPSPSPPDTAATPAGAPTTGAPTPDAVVLPVVVTMRSLTPIAPQPGDVLRLTGTLRNVSTGPVSDLGLQLRYNPTRIGSRSEFDDYAIGSRTGPNGAFGPLPLPPVVFSAATVVLGQHALAPGATERFAISVKLDGLQLQAWQVYELGVQVNGSTTAGFGPVGGLRTFLPWAPVGVPGVGVPTQVAWVWPLVDRPHRSVGNTWLDDGLAKAIGAGGRLADLLAAGKAAQDQRPPPPRRSRRKKAPKPRPTPQVTPVPVTWAIDPLLVEDVAAMANGYRVGTGRAAKAKAPSDEARAWLDALKDATRTSETLALPYADPDIVAATRAGLGSQVQVAINSGTTSLSRLLSTQVLSYDWPPGGVVDQRTLDTLFAAGVTTVLLDGAALPPVDPPSVTPGARTTVRARDGNLDALLTDSGLTTVVGIGAQNPDKGPLAIQRFLAETLMVQAERPSLQRTLVVAPDRRWAPAPAYAAALLADTGKVPWIAPVPLSRALDTAATSDVPRLPLNYPAALRRTELARSYLAQVRALKDRADTFAAILPTPGDPHARTFDDALLRTTSSGWRDQRSTATQFLDDVGTQLRATMRRVRIASLPGSFVTLTSHSGSVPVTVANDLDTPVSVIVAISSQHLKVSGGGRKAQTIQPHRQISVDVQAEARTSGVFQLDVQLLTPRGDVYDAEQLFVRSTAYGSVAILITAGATGVLLFAVAIRLTHRALGARRSARTTPA
jgi:hypothetical protein